MNQLEQSGALVRVYTMHQREEVEISDVVAGMFSTFEWNVYVLFDFGSTHSYVSARIIRSAAISLLGNEF